MILDFEAANDRSLIEAGTGTTSSWFDAQGYWDARTSGHAPAPRPDVAAAGAAAAAELARVRAQSLAAAEATAAAQVRAAAQARTAAHEPAAASARAKPIPRRPEPAPRPQQQATVASRVPPSLPSSPAFDSPGGPGGPGMASKTIYPGMPGLGAALGEHMRQQKADALASSPANDGFVAEAPAFDADPADAQPVSGGLSELSSPELVTELAPDFDVDTGVFDEDPEHTTDMHAGSDDAEQHYEAQDGDVADWESDHARSARRPAHTPPATSRPLGPDGGQSTPGMPLAAHSGQQRSSDDALDDFEEARSGSMLARIMFAVILGAIVMVGALSYVAWSSTGDPNPLPILQQILADV